MLEILHIRGLNSVAILYREDGLTFLGERWSYHLSKHTTGRLLTSTIVLMKICTPSIPFCWGARSICAFFLHTVLEASTIVVLLDIDNLSLTKRGRGK